LLCAKGHSVKLSEEIYRQIESFVGYSFQALAPLLMRLKVTKAST
jgi:hypothetical protein